MRERNNSKIRLVWAIGICILFVGTSIVPGISADWWPMFGHDLSHSRYSTSTAPNTANVLWTFTTGGEVRSSPTVANGKVYVGSYDDKVYCLDATTGAKLWNYTTGGSVFSSPAVANGKVYIGSDMKVYCLDAATGEHIWNYSTTAYGVSSSPAVADGKVYIEASDGKVYCLNAATGEHIWNYSTVDATSSSPAVANGKVYIGSDMKVYCLDAATGEHIWNYSTAGGVSSSPAVADGKVYIGSNDDKVYCLDAATGEHIWNYSTSFSVDSSPAVANGKVYIGSTDYEVYCLDAATGEDIWNYTTGSYVVSSPAVADGKVYVGSYDDKVYCLDATTGAKLWNYTTGSYVVSSPAVADGKVYIGSNDDKVYCFGASNQPPNTPSTPSGPSSGYTETSYTYSTSTTDPDGNNVYYWFDWGDGANSGWVGPYASGVTGSASHSWSSPGTYSVKVKAKDTYGAESGYSALKTIVITTKPVNHPPNEPKTPTGPTTQLMGQVGTYWANGTDPDGDIIQYQFDWNAAGSHEYSAWTSLVNSGTKLSQPHSWATPGTYVVKVQSRDEHGMLSIWSAGLTVTVTSTANQPPNQPLKPTGPPARCICQNGQYWAKATDPDGDNVQYRFDWNAAGSHQYSAWTQLVKSGTSLSIVHSWTTPGTYVVKVQARDEHGKTSTWSTGLTVIVHT